MTQIDDDYDRNGYAVFRGLLSNDSISDIFDQIERVFDTSLSAIGERITDHAGVDAKYLQLKTRHPEIKAHCYNVLGMLHGVRHALSNETVLAFGRKLYGTPLLAGYMQVRIDDPSDDRLLPMHQELELMSLMNLNIWIPLTDTGGNRGGLRVVPGSHRSGLHVHHRVEEPQNYWSLPLSLIDEERVVTLDLAAGDALVFHPFLFHGSVPNSSSTIRWTLVGRWSELNHVPYLRSARASMSMDRNPDPTAPGNQFVRQYLATSK